MTSLMERYNRPAPRYTSYPPAPHWRDAGADLLDHALRRSSRPLSIYLHVPFCEKLCLYCGCNTIIRKDHSLAEPYLEHVIGEMDLLRPHHGRLTTQIHWGGGTPTYLNPRQLGILFNAIVTRFAVPRDAEISIEIDPRVTTDDQLQTLRSLGFNRLSLGVQDFDPQVQQAIHRIQPFEMTEALMDKARSLGFESINVDLIYGLPHQNRYSFARTLELVRRLSPDRIAVFSYAHVPSLKKQQRALEAYLPGENEKLGLFVKAIEDLTAHGYNYIGLDHFARPEDPLSIAAASGTLHRNFQGYTTHAASDLVGFGVSAISNIGDVFTQNHRELTHYAAAIQLGRLPVARGYIRTEDDCIRGAVIEGILCNAQLVKSEIENRFDIDVDEYFEDELRALEEFEKDLLVSDVWSDVITVTPIGRIYNRAIAQVFDAFSPASVASRAV
jgi:oxygen-independent coproporphyrinogen-3 oxidase